MYNNTSFFEIMGSGPTGNSPPIAVSFGNINIHDYTGPVPFVDFAKTFNFNGNGVVETITHNITLTGKIVKTPFDSSLTGSVPQPIPSGQGIKGIIAAITGLEQKLINCPVGIFQIKCANANDSTVLYQATGVKVASYQFDKTADNWAQTADYSISFEYTTNADPNSPMVTDMSDNWSIEPLDDIMFEDYDLTVTQRGEWNNPLLKPNAPASQGQGGGTTIPAGNINNGPGTVWTRNGTLRMVSVPQYRITRSIGCKGIPVQPSGSSSGVCFTGAGTNISNIDKYNRTAFTSAKAWVDRELNKTYNGTAWKTSGVLYFTDNSAINSFSTLLLFNHVRTTNIDIYNGTYEVNESWVAMPTGIPFTEEYNIDMSTGEDFTKTVRVAGTIKGLAIANMNYMSMSGIQSPVPSALVPTGNQGFDGKLNLSSAVAPALSGAMAVGILSDIPDAKPATKLTNNYIYGNRYQNALSGWLHNVKPYLYRRASLGVNSLDRNASYIPMTAQGTLANGTPTVPNNPIYSYEALLNPVPRATTEGHDPRRGTISYSYEYSNSSMIISGVISENITITTDAPTDVINETQVIGRSLGPIMTKTGRTSPRKSISVEIVVPKASKPSEMWMANADCPLYTGGYIYNYINLIIEGVKPFGRADAAQNYIWGSTYVANTTSALTPKLRNAPRPGIVYVSSDQDNWNPTAGRYSRSVSWTYQQCGNNINYMDH